MNRDDHANNLAQGDHCSVTPATLVLADPYWGAKAADGRLAEIRLYDKSADTCLFSRA